MQDILKKLSDLLHICTEKDHQLDEGIKDLKQKKAEFEAAVSDHKDAKDDHAEREQVLKEQEARLLRNDQLDEKKAALDAQASELANERSAFEDYKAQENARLTEMAGQQQALKDSLEAREKQLSDDKAAYKKQIMDAIIADADGSTKASIIAAKQAKEAAQTGV